MKKSILLIFVLLLSYSCNEDGSVTSSNANNTVRLVATISLTGSDEPTIVFTNESGGTSQVLSKSLNKSFKVKSGTNISLSASCHAKPIYDRGLYIAPARCSIDLKIYINGKVKANGENAKKSSSSFNLSASCSTVVP